jgi:GxxExxY protein
MGKLLFEEETHRILGACYEVYKEKGCGFTEPVYQECLQLELAGRGIQFIPQQEIRLSYKGQLLRQTFKADFICFGTIILEIKAVSALVDEHRAQVMNYLRATGLRVAQLINFSHHPGIQHERFVI